MSRYRHDVRRLYSIEIISRTDDGGLSLALVDAPKWTLRLIAVGYWVLRLTNDRFGVSLVARAYRIHDRCSRKFEMPADPTTVAGFRDWQRERRRGRKP